MSGPAAGDEAGRLQPGADEARLREASRTLARLAAERQAAEDTARTVAEARRRLAERQQTPPSEQDAATRWGRIVGRSLGFLALAGLLAYLAVAYLLP